MLEGWLVVNGYITNPKFLEIYDWLQRAGEKQNCRMVRKTNTELMLQFAEPVSQEEKPDFVIFWDKDVRLARLMQGQGIRLFNPAQAIEYCDDKSLTYLELIHTGVKQPRTYIAPKTFAAEGYDRYDFFYEVEKKLGYPMVIKECFGSFGKQVYLAKNQKQMLGIVKNLKNRPFLMQEYIQTSWGRDVRINMVGEEAVAAMYRYNDDDFRANITNGGSMKPYTPNEAQIEMARKVCRALQLDFAGVDILFGENEEPILCEVNSNAHFKNIFDCTGINVADATISYIKEQL